MDHNYVESFIFAKKLGAWEDVMNYKYKVGDEVLVGGQKGIISMRKHWAIIKMNVYQLQEDALHYIERDIRPVPKFVVGEQVACRGHMRHVTGRVCAYGSWLYYVSGFGDEMVCESIIGKSKPAARFELGDRVEYGARHGVVTDRVWCAKLGWLYSMSYTVNVVVIGEDELVKE